MPDARTWVAASPDGALLAIGCGNGRLTLWSLPDRAVAHAFDADDYIVRARWTPDGSRLLVASTGGRLYVRGGDGRSSLG